MTRPGADPARDSRRAAILLAAAALLLSASPLLAQPHPNLDFEDGLRGWTAAGDAFTGQPIEVSAQRGRFPASPLGGDYWDQSPYSTGHSGRFAIRSADAGRGSLTSDWFDLPDGAALLVLGLGGSAPPEAISVEMQIDGQDGASPIVLRAVPLGLHALQQHVMAIPSGHSNRRARIVFVDDSARGHVAADDVRLTSAAPPVDASPLWGLADYHAHPMSHLGFGALRGVPMLWGRPGTVAERYAADPSLFELDIPQCSNDHGGGNTAGIFINTVEKRLLPRDVRPQGFVATVRALWKLFTGGFTHHQDEGAPEFEHYPGFLAGAHQQMHVTQLHRAWQGGLRLMVAHAVHNEGVEFLTSPGRDTQPSTEREVLEAQVCGMRRLAEHNAAWMEIAYTPADARRIIAAGRLAVVLGAELDRLGELPGFSSIDEEVQYLYDLGVRQVIPIHGIDNRLGGAAVFEPAYNSLNDLVKRGERFLGADDLARWPPVFFDVRDGGCTRGPLAGRRGDCVLFRFSTTQERALVARTAFSPFSRTPTLGQVQVPDYAGHDGHMNVRGLTDDGRSYVRALLSRGMLVTIDHMSQQSADDLFASLGGSEHPVLVSHAHFRALSIQDRRRTTAVGFLPDEFDVADRDVEMVRQRGGVVGVFTYENPLDPHPLVTASFDNDCSASTKTLAYALLYALARMGGAGVGLATDFTFVPSTAPRFGPNACWGLKAHWDARPDVGPLRGQYEPARQKAGVRYEGRPPAQGVAVADTPPLAPYSMGRRTYDFNVDGFAHYGMLPDLLQDLRNIGLGAREFGTLFSSAEAYLKMWEKTERLATPGAAAARFTPRPLACEQICRGLCP